MEGLICWADGNVLYDWWFDTYLFVAILQVMMNLGNQEMNMIFILSICQS